MERKKRKISSSLLSLLLYLLMIVAVLLAFKARTNEGISLFGFRMLEVVTGSMEPVIPTGSIILIRNTDTVENKNIITFHPEGSEALVTHRVREVLNDGKQFITKGDANNTIDRGIVNKENILGKYIGKIPFSSELNQLLKTKKGWLFLVAVLVCVLYVKWTIKQFTVEVRKNK